jgi:hypothetical protein
MRKRARTVLCGGRSAMVVPTATMIQECRPTFAAISFPGVLQMRYCPCTNVRAAHRQAVAGLAAGADKRLKPAGDAGPPERSGRE